MRFPILLAACLAATVAPAAAHAQTTPARALSVTAGDLLVTKSGESGVAQVTVKNTGRLAARKVVLTVRAGAGTRVKTTTRRLPSSLAAGKSRTLGVGVRLTRASGGKVTVTARAERTKAATRSFAVKVGTGLEGRVFQEFRNTGVAVSVVETVTFLDGKTAFVGLPETPQTCAPVVEGCKPYIYDRASGAIRIGEVTGKLTTSEDGQISITTPEADYDELFQPPAGARITVNAQNNNAVGTCTGGSTCSQFSRDLQLRADGTFSAAYSAFVEGQPSGPQLENGTYAFTGRSIKLTYTDGTVLERPFGILIFKGTQPDYDWALLGSTLFVDLSD